MALGCMYRDGRGVDQDFAVALQWFRKAGTRNPSVYTLRSNSAQNYIGEMYLHGQGVAVDYAMALQCFTRAGKSCSNALLHLGIMYLEGKGVPKDYIKAKKYFIKSRHVDAKEWLACMSGVRLRPARKSSSSAGTMKETGKNQLLLSFSG